MGDHRHFHPRVHTCRTDRRREPTRDDIVQNGPEVADDQQLLPVELIRCRFRHRVNIDAPIHGVHPHQPLASGADRVRRVAVHRLHDEQRFRRESPRHKRRPIPLGDAPTHLPRQTDSPARRAHDHGRLGRLGAALDAVDHRVAVHRGQAHDPGAGVLHPVPGDEQVHHDRDGAARLLHAGRAAVRALLQDLPGDGEAAEGTGEATGEPPVQEGVLKLYFQVVNTNISCRW